MFFEAAVLNQIENINAMFCLYLTLLVRVNQVADYSHWKMFFPLVVYYHESALWLF
jgi:hypothetical protein